MKEKELIKEIREKFCHVEECPYSGKRIFFENAGGSLTLKSVVTKPKDTVHSPLLTTQNVL